MKHPFGLVTVASLIVVFFAGCNPQGAPATLENSDEPIDSVPIKPVEFSSDVLPILQRSCFPCHGPKMSPLSMAGFRVDLREQAVDRGKIIPGDPDKSPLIKRLVTKQKSKRMPPLKAKNPPLSAEEIDLLKRWIEEGATFGKQ